MSRFVLTAQLNLQAPTNTRQVVSQIQRQLQGVNVNVGLRNAPATQRQLTQINNQVNTLNRSGRDLTRTFGLSIRRFAAFNVASRGVSLFANKIAGATAEAIKFEREVVKIAQVTGKTVQQLDGLTKTVTRLSVGLGVASQELIGTSRILAQAGIAANDLEVALAALAKTTLAPTFENIEKTAEGAVAILAQFKQGVGALEDQLGSINKVAGKFAVESGDLISAVRRFGGVFKSAGGELEELLGLFTSVRATTRESAESIATGLRTIFTRIQRPKTIRFLKQFGVELTDLEGKFVGPFEAVRQLSQAFAGLEEGDITFVKVAEELGGFRQIGKVIPLIQQFTVAEQARQAALEGRGSLDEDAAKAQQSLAVQIQKVREEFFALIRGISETGTFRVLIQSTLELTSGLIKLVDAFKPLLPILATVAGFKVLGNLGNIARGVGAGFLGRNQGGPIPFARGGVVPGSGNRDTVPAMLTPGEFVIRKSSVNKIGAGTLAAMNENRFQNGGDVSGRRKLNKNTEAAIGGTGTLKFALRPDSIGGFILNPPNKGGGTYSPKADKFTFTNQKTIRRLALKAGRTEAEADELARKGVKAELDSSAGYPEFYPSKGSIKKNRKYQGAVRGGAKTGLVAGIRQTIKRVQEQSLLDVDPAFKTDETLMNNVERSLTGDNNVVSTIGGYLFEGMIGALTGAQAAGGLANFDFPEKSLTGNRSKLLALFGDRRIRKIKKAEGKRDRGEFAKKEGVLKKTKNDLNDFGLIGSSGVRLVDSFRKTRDPKTRRDQFPRGTVTRNRGGGIPGSTDTVPALLTPGEFVINKKAAQSIGAGNLNRMNKQGVVGFNKGGAVGGIQKFQAGGGVGAVGGLIVLQSLPAIIDQIFGSVDKTTQSLAELEKGGFGVRDAFSSLVTTVATVGIALSAFGLQLNASGIGKLFGRGKGSISQKVSSAIRSATGKSRLASKGGFRGQFRANQSGLGSFAGDPVGLRGKAGARLGKLSRGGGRLGRLAGGLGRLGGLAGRAGGLAVAGAGGAAASIAAVAGPLAGIALAAKGVSAALASGFDAQGKYNRAIKEGNVAKAEEFAVLKEASGIAQLFGEAGAEFELGIKAFFGGQSVESIKALAGAAAQASKSLKEVEANNKKLDVTLRSLKDGAITLDEAFATGQITAGIKSLQTSRDTTRAAQAANVRSNRAGLGREIFGTLPGIENAAAKNARLDEEAKKANKEALDKLNQEIEKQIPLFRDLARQTIIGGGSLEDFIKAAGLEGLDRNSEAVKRVTEEYNNQIPALKRAAEAAEAINLGLNTVNRTTTGLAATLNSINSTSSVLETSLANLEAVSKGGAISQGLLTESLESVTGALGEFGASDASLKKINSTFQALGQASNGAEAALAKIRDQFAGGGSFQPDQFVEQFTSAIAGKDNTGVKDILDGIFADFKPSDTAVRDFVGGNFGAILDELQAKGKGAFDELLPSIQGVIAAQQALGNSIRTLNKAKLDEANAIRRSLDLQLQAAQILEEFGGKAVSAADKIGFLDQRARASGFGSSSATSLSVGANLAAGRFSAGRPDDPVEAARQEEANAQAKRAQEDTLKIAQERVKLYREEIAVAKQKLKLEQDAAQALLANDIAKFAENINASIAASAFRTGDTTSLQALGGDAVAAGFASLTDAEKKAARPQLEALGLSSGLADAAAATSPEIQALEAEARKFANVIADVATNLEKIAQLEREEAERRKKQSEEEFAQKQATAQQEAENLQSSQAIENQQTSVAAAEQKTAKEEAQRLSEEDKKRQASLDAEIKRGEQQALRNTSGSSLQQQLSISGLPEERRQLIEDELERRREAGRRAAQQQVRYGYATGGTVYASRGMFIPRGTDTVPAMLTPGEFVVNRAAVQRGNNLSILRAMNGGDTAPNGSPAAMSKGGSVGYYQNGGEVGGGMGEFVQGFSQAISQLGGAFGTFSQSVQQLAQMKLSVDLSPTRVDVNVIGPMLSELTEATKEVVLNAVVSEIQLNQLGQLERTV